jgi:hypothetical protein
LQAPSYTELSTDPLQWGISHPHTEPKSTVGFVAILIHTWVIMEETFNPLGVSLAESLESRCCHLILNSSV